MSAPRIACRPANQPLAVAAVAVARLNANGAMAPDSSCWEIRCSAPQQSTQTTALCAKAPVPVNVRSVWVLGGGRYGCHSGLHCSSHPSSMQSVQKRQAAPLSALFSMLLGLGQQLLACATFFLLPLGLCCCMHAVILQAVLQSLNQSSPCNNMLATDLTAS